MWSATQTHGGSPRPPTGRGAASGSRGSTPRADRRPAGPHRARTPARRPPDMYGTTNPAPLQMRRAPDTDRPDRRRAPNLRPDETRDRDLPRRADALRSE